MLNFRVVLLGVLILVSSCIDSKGRSVPLGCMGAVWFENQLNTPISLSVFKPLGVDEYSNSPQDILGMGTRPRFESHDQKVYKHHPCGLYKVSVWIEDSTKLYMPDSGVPYLSTFYEVKADKETTFILYGKFDKAGSFIKGQLGQANVIIGSEGSEEILGGHKEDYIDGLGGIDKLIGGLSDDVFIYDPIDKMIDGQGGIDSLIIESSVDLVFKSGNFPRLLSIEKIIMEDAEGVVTLDFDQVHAMSPQTNLIIIGQEGGDNRAKIISDFSPPEHAPDGTYVTGQTTQGLDVTIQFINFAQID
jgi:hypothetical protein